jgi:hypothetical protein
MMPRLFTKFATGSNVGTGLGLIYQKTLLKLMEVEYGLRITLMERELRLALAYLLSRTSFFPVSTENLIHYLHSLKISDQIRTASVNLK